MAYDGKPHPVTVEIAAGVSGIGSPLCVKYNGDANTIPTSAGKYIISIDAPAGSVYTAIENMIIYSFEITRISPGH
jgi:hypothetical protein